jgi:hypothetical protein
MKAEEFDQKFDDGVEDINSDLDLSTACRVNEKPHLLNARVVTQQGCLKKIVRSEYTSIGHEGFLIFAYYVFDGVADLVDDSVLYLGLRIDTLNRFRETFQAVYTGNEDVFKTTVVQIC